MVSHKLVRCRIKHAVAKDYVAVSEDGNIICLPFSRIQPFLLYLIHGNKVGELLRI